MTKTQNGNSGAPVVVPITMMSSFSHLWKKALDELNKFRIIEVRYINFENILNFI